MTDKNLINEANLWLNEKLKSQFGGNVNMEDLTFQFGLTDKVISDCAKNVKKELKGKKVAITLDKYKVKTGMFKDVKCERWKYNLGIRYDIQIDDVWYKQKKGLHTFKIEVVK